jgi:ribosomal protein S15P/S13E
VLTALEAYRSNKNVELLVSKLEKVANYYRAKELLEDVDSN